MEARQKLQFDVSHSMQNTQALHFRSKTMLNNARAMDDVTSMETVSMYQKHNLVGKGPIHDMLASNYDMVDKTVIQSRKRAAANGKEK